MKKTIANKDFMAQKNLFWNHQDAMHPKLEEMHQKQQQYLFQKKYHDFSQVDFDIIDHKVQHLKRPIILDTCVGKGHSTEKLSIMYPEHLVIGIDQSLARLSANPGFQSKLKTLNFEPGKPWLIRGDLFDWYRLIHQAKWPISIHYMLYPNPYPKKSQIKKRWYGHPVFPKLIQIADKHVICSNWLLYLQEFAEMAQKNHFNASLKPHKPKNGLSAFEIKYLQKEQPLYKLFLTKQKQSAQ
jgi:tRNA (guanine-N7-)-methyltransferase